MLEVKSLSKSYVSTKAVNNVSLHVNKGSIYGLVGSNGAGKTTLMKLLTGIYIPDAGTVTVEGQPVLENTDIKTRVILIPDQPYHFTNYSIRDMAVFYGRIYKNWNQERYLKLQKVFGMDVRRRIRTLSKGMQRQVAFWLALSAMPDLLILDEPLDGLDPVMRQKVKNLIVQDVAEREMTVIISSHNLRELEDLCDSIAIMHKGEVLIQKELDEMKSDVHKIQLAFSDSVPGEDAFAGLDILHREERGSVRILIVRGNYDNTVDYLKKLSPAVMDVLPLTLEEIFIYEMGDNGYEVKNIVY